MPEVALPGGGQGPQWELGWEVGSAMAGWQEEAELGQAEALTGPLDHNGCNAEGWGEQEKELTCCVGP